jgi:hypothetical protein
MDFAFENCTGMTGVFFQGVPPMLELNPHSGTHVFFGDTNATVYYIPGVAGWGVTFGGRPTAQWFLPHPLILENSSGFGMKTNMFGFAISWATNISVIVEACTNLVNPVWQQLQTNTITNGSFYFGDAQWTNYSGRFYRVRTR